MALAPETPHCFSLPTAQPILAAALLPSAKSFAVEFIMTLSDELAVELLAAVASHHSLVGSRPEMTAVELLQAAARRAKKGR